MGISGGAAGGSGVAESAVRVVAQQHETVRGSQQMTRRTVFMYMWSGLMLLVVNVVVAPVADPFFSRVDFTSASPMLGVGATVAIGLHVAVFNLAHDRADVPREPDVVARLDAFATGGIVVALTSASAGWLLLWPDVAAGRPEGLNLLGGMLSVVVVLVAGMAGHIVPASAMRSLADARRDYERAWLTKTVHYWELATPIGAAGVVGLLCWCALPAVVVAVVIANPLGGFDLEEFAAALIWSVLSMVAPVLFIVAIDRLLHRRYWTSGLIACTAGVLVVLQVAAMVRDAAGDVSWFVLTAYPFFVWFVLSRSLMRQPTTSRRQVLGLPRVPRVARAALGWSLARRLAKMTVKSSGWSASWLESFVARFKLATGRTG